jgi:hypothetical protein
MSETGDHPVFEFKCMFNKRTADGRLYPNRLEISSSAPLNKGRHSEMLPLRMIGSVSSARDGLGWVKVTVHSSGNDTEFRVKRSIADDVVGRIRAALL